MRLTLYYALHSFINQVRKMLKTWVLIFILVCALIGGVIGAGAVKIGELSEETAAQTEAAAQTETETQTETAEEEIEPETPVFSLTEALGLEKSQLTELAAGAVILGVLIWQCLSADTNGSKIFLPADVNLLFSSPMTPQGVLMFRLMTKLGTFIFLGFYLLLQVPNLVLNLGLSLWAALALIAVWCLTVTAGSLMQVLLYLLCSDRPGTKTVLRRGIYALLGVVLLAWGIRWKGSGLTPAGAAAALFNAPLSRAIPFWGWLKGIFLFVNEGNAAGALACFGALLLGCAALLWGIRRVKADYYEDAMAKSEETAEMMERLRAEQTGRGLSFRKRKKDRGDGVRRDGLHRGWGASVFFHKTMYNRFRFAHLGFFTKTMETYLAAGLAVAAVSRFMYGKPTVVPAMLAIAGLAFFRSLGNPMTQDTKMGFFLLIPESAWSKLFYSLLGGAACCLLDVLPAALAAALLAGDSVLTALAWVPFVVSVDFYATCVATFIDLSVPVAAGATIKQIVQVMFIYFGLLPDVALIAVGMALGHTVPAAVGAAGINMFFGALFFALSPLFLEPGSKRGGSAAPGSELPEETIRQARRVFSRLGWSTVLVLAVGTLLQILFSYVAPASWYDRSWYVWAVTFAPLYLAAFPLGGAAMRRVPASRGKDVPLSGWSFLSLIPICIFLLYAGNYLGLGINALLERALGAASSNPVESYALDDNLALKVLCLVVLAPCFEELLFRRWLIDRMRPYGEQLAVLISALMFGLFHGNLSQFFYAAALGALFGYVYLRTGRLRYTTALHMLINAIGSVIGPALMSRADMEAEGELTLWTAVFYGYSALLLLAALAGAVLFTVRRREIYYEPAPMELPRGKRCSAALLNPGMIVMLLGCLAMFVVNITGI